MVDQIYNILGIKQYVTTNPNWHHISLKHTFMTATRTICFFFCSQFFMN